MMISRIEKTICTAIQQKRLLTFFYESTQRTVEPHILAYGSGEEALLLSGWQLSGGSGEGWRNFQVLKMTIPNIAEKCFLQPRPGFKVDDPKYALVVCHLSQKDSTYPIAG